MATAPADGLRTEATTRPVTVDRLPPAVPRPLQWRRLRQQLAILREADPARVLDAAYSTGDAIGGMSEERLVRRFLASAEGQRLLTTRPSLAEALADREALAALPEGSLGRAFLAFSERQGRSKRLNDRALPIFIAMSLLMRRIKARNAWEAFQRGWCAGFLPAAPFEELLPLPLEAVREKLGVSPPEIAHPGPNSEGMLIAAHG